MQNTDAINETIRGIDPGAEFQWVDEHELRRMTAEGWRLIGAVMEKRFVSTLPHHYVSDIVCVECRNPVQEIHGSCPTKYQRSTTCTLVEVVRFLVVRERDDVIAELNVKLEERRQFAGEKAGETTQAKRDLKESTDALASTKEELEQISSGRDYYQREFYEIQGRMRLAEAVIARARDELGAARWRELVGHLENPEDDEDDDE
jgi:hypothetical protein